MYSLWCPTLQTRKLTRSYTAQLNFPSGFELLVAGAARISRLQKMHCDVLSIAIQHRLQGGGKKKIKNESLVNSSKSSMVGSKEEVSVLSTRDS